MKILILKPSSLGDVVQALPVLRLIKKWKPEAKVYWWIASQLGPLLEGDPDLEGLYYFQRRGWSQPEFWFHVADELRRMRAMKFDWVIDLQSLARSALTSWLVNGGLIVGLDDRREGASGFYDLMVPRPSFQTHAVDWYLDVLRKLNVPVHADFDWLPKRPTVAARIQAERKNFSRLVLLNPGARWVNKRWPIENFARLAEMIGTLPDTGVAIVGSGSETSLAKEISRKLAGQVLDLSGKTSLPEMVEWIRAADLMVTNDTGPMHVAAGVGTPLVSLFGPTTPKRTGPYGQLDHAMQTQLGCVPCMKPECTNPNELECLRSISPEAVFRSVQARLAL